MSTEPVTCPGRLLGLGWTGCERSPRWRVSDPVDGEVLAVTCDDHLSFYINDAGFITVNVEDMSQADEEEES